MKSKPWLFGLLIVLAQSSIQAQESNSSQPPLFRIRTITAGVNLKSLSDSKTLESAMAFLGRAKKEYEKAGYEVQTLRIATQPLGEYLDGHSLDEAISELKEIDRLLTSRDVLLAVGPVISEDRYDPDLPNWAARLIEATNNISFSVSVASGESGLHQQAVRSAAEIMVAISKTSKGGEGNFRFTATANCPPDIPFFPAAYHRGSPSFAVGL
jgi:uncharacterized protein (UPF0210 family)